METEQTIRVKSKSRCIPLILIVSFIGLCVIGLLIELIFLLCFCSYTSQSFDDCLKINYVLYVVMSPIIGFIIYITSLSLSEIKCKI